MCDLKYSYLQLLCCAQSHFQVDDEKIVIFSFFYTQSYVIGNYSVDWFLLFRRSYVASWPKLSIMCVKKSKSYFPHWWKDPLFVRWIGRKSLCAVRMSRFAKGSLLPKIVYTSLLRIASQHIIAVTKEFGQALCRHYKHKNAIMESSLFSPVDLAQRKGHLNWYQCQCMSWIFNGFLLVGLTIWSQVEHLRASVLY